jgi:beta-glucosidase
MQNRKPEGVNVMYSRGCDWTETIETKYAEGGDERAWEYELLHRKVDAGEKADKAEALKMAKDADVIIAAVGENVMLCGENRDREGLRLPGKQEQYVEELLKTGKPVVLVMFGGRAQVISGIAEKCAAVIQAWYPGEEGGNAVADILYGKVSPSAKLSVSYPNTEINEPICYNYSTEKDARVAWPFGYGLSYTTFDYAKPAVKVSGETVTVSVTIKNTGRVSGKEAVQVYVTAPAGQLEKPAQELKAFAKTCELKPGESQTLTMQLQRRDLASYDEAQSQWLTEAGTYQFRIGASSRDIRQTVTATVKQYTEKTTDALKTAQ